MRPRQTRGSSAGVPLTLVTSMPFHPTARASPVHRTKLPTETRLCPSTLPVRRLGLRGGRDQGHVVSISYVREALDTVHLANANSTSERSSEVGVGGRGNPIFLWPPGTVGASERGSCPAVQKQGRAREVPHRCPPSLSLHDLGKMHQGPVVMWGRGAGWGARGRQGRRAPVPGSEGSVCSRLGPGPGTCIPRRAQGPGDPGAGVLRFQGSPQLPQLPDHGHT